MRADLILKVIGTAVLALIGWQIGLLTGSSTQQPRNAILGVAIGAILGFVLSPWLVIQPVHALRRVVDRMPVEELLVAVGGLILGLVVGVLLAFPLSFLPWWFGRLLPIAVSLLGAYLGLSLTWMRRREVLRFVHVGGTPEKPAAPPSPGPLLIDTSAIIDGRIADISQTHFLRGTLTVPRFVLKELQHIADSSDALRRARGRRGLEVLNRLQKEATIDVEISDLDVREVGDVDGKLVLLARQLDAPIVTNDFNLNRVAQLEGVAVLNINELANALKPVVLPGEELSVHVIQEGKEFNQGVAYLDDGTMIVVENGRRHLHSDVEVLVTRVLQTVAGRMIFAHPKGDARN